MTQRQIKSFQKEILDWYQKHQRDLPWRRIPYDSRLGKRDPYKILVSEVMLQQTQVGRVIPKYEAWMKAFPTLESLSQASTRDVLLHWSGLGYNRRALYLQKLAQALVYSSKEQSESRSSGSSRLRSNNNSSTSLKEEIVWPQTENELRQLPGIGEYTSRALLCFAFDQQIAVVDTNVRKVILVRFGDVIPDLIRNLELDSRFRGKDKEESAIRHLAEQLLPQGKAYEWNQALMDYAGAMLKEHKIPILRQSTFKDSDRYFRGQILKRLLEVHVQTEQELLQVFKSKKTPIEQVRLAKVLETLEKDNFIVRKNQKISLT